MPLPRTRDTVIDGTGRRFAAALDWNGRAGLDTRNRLIPFAQPCAIGYFAKISSTRLNVLSAAACGVIPPEMMSAQATAQTCSFCSWAYAGFEVQKVGTVGPSAP